QAIDAPSGHEEKSVHVVVVQQGGDGKAGIRVLMLAEPGRKAGGVHPAVRQRLSHVVRKVEVEDGVDAAGVAGNRLRYAGGLAEDQGVRLDPTQAAPQAGPEGRVDA